MIQTFSRTILLPFLKDWLSVIDLGQLDSAYCSTSDRETLLNYYADEHVLFTGIDAFAIESYLLWLQRRKIRCSLVKCQPFRGTCSTIVRRCFLDLQLVPERVTLCFDKYFSQVINLISGKLRHLTVFCTLLDSEVYIPLLIDSIFHCPELESFHIGSTSEIRNEVHGTDESDDDERTHIMIYNNSTGKISTKVFITPDHNCDSTQHVSNNDDGSDDDDNSADYTSDNDETAHNVGRSDGNEDIFSLLYTDNTHDQWISALNETNIEDSLPEYSECIPQEVGYRPKPYPDYVHNMEYDSESDDGYDSDGSDYSAENYVNPSSLLVGSKFYNMTHNMHPIVKAYRELLFAKNGNSSDGSAQRPLSKLTSFTSSHPDLCDSFLMLLSEATSNLTSVSIPNNQMISRLSLKALVENNKHIRSLDISRCEQITDGCLSALTKSCQNLQEIDISICTNMTETGICNFVVAAKQLTSFIRNRNSPAADYMIILNTEILKQLLAHTPGLTRLEVMNHLFESTAFETINFMLVSVNLSYCQQLTDEMLKPLIVSCGRTLQVIDISGNAWLTVDTLDAINEHCVVLESLYIVQNDGMTEGLHMLPHTITDLNISGLALNDNQFMYLVASSLPDLRSVDISCCELLTAACIMSFVQNAAFPYGKLRFVNLSCCNIWREDVENMAREHAMVTFNSFDLGL